MRLAGDGVKGVEGVKEEAVEEEAVQEEELATEEDDGEDIASHILLSRSSLSHFFWASDTARTAASLTRATS